FSTSNFNGMFVDQCNIKVSRSTMTDASQSGIYLGSNSRYSIQNCFIYGNAVGVTFVSNNGSTGKFSFNTVGNNTTTAGINCSAACTIADTIVFGNKKGGGSQFNGTLCTLSNVVTGTDTYSGAGNKITLDPSFVGATDLHLDLTAGMPLNKNQACCIDK